MLFSIDKEAEERQKPKMPFGKVRWSAREPEASCRKLRDAFRARLRI